MQRSPVPIKVAPAFIVIVAGQIVLGSLAGFLVVPMLGVGLILVQRLHITPFVRGEPIDAEEAELERPAASERRARAG